MRRTDEALMRALVDETSSTAEALSSMGANADLIRVPKPSRESTPGVPPMTDPTEAALDALLASSTPDAERWELVFVALPDPCPAAVRFKALLKRALRSHRLRCVAVRNPTTPEKPK